MPQAASAASRRFVGAGIALIELNDKFLLIALPLKDLPVAGRFCSVHFIAFTVLVLVCIVARAQVEGGTIFQPDIDIPLPLGKGTGSPSVMLCIAVPVELAARVN
jgi:hypothetical protein